MKYFAYHEVKKSQKEVEFGWIPVDSLPVANRYVLTTINGEESTSLLEDHIKYFKNYTGESPEDFVKNWGGSMKMLAAHWKSNYPMAKDMEFVFFLDLAKFLTGVVQSFQFNNQTFSWLAVS